MATPQADQSVLIHARVPAWLKSLLEQAAARNGRSLNAELIEQLSPSASRRIVESYARLGLETSLEFERQRFGMLKLLVEAALERDPRSGDADSPYALVVRMLAMQRQGAEKLERLLDERKQMAESRDRAWAVSQSGRGALSGGEEINSGVATLDEAIANLHARLGLQVPKAEPDQGTLEARAATTAEAPPDVFGGLATERAADSSRSSGRTLTSSELLELRRVNLERVLSERGRGAKTYLAQRLAISQSHVSHWLKGADVAGARPIHKGTARDIEKALGLEPGALDRPIREPRKS